MRHWFIGFVVAIPGSAQIVFFCFLSLQSQLTVLPSSHWTFILGAFCAPLMYWDMCPLFAVTMPDRSSRLYWGRLFIGWSLDMIELFCGSFGITIFFSSLGDQLSFYYPAMDMVKWRTLSLFSWLLLSFCISLAGLAGLSLCLTIFLGTFFITPFCSCDNLQTHACGVLTFTSSLLFS